MESNENSLYEFYLENILSHLLKQADILQMKSWKRDEIFLSSDGQYGPFKFINMCVSDSLLTTLYNCYLRTDQVRSLFDSHKVLRAAMFFVGAQMYNEAKACWLFAQIVLYKNLKITKEYNTFTKQFEINAWSEPADHLHTFNELVLGICHFDEGRNSPSLSQEILYKTLSKFESLGDVLALGLEEHHPIVILVDVDLRMETAPPLTISDSYDRVYELQCLLMTRKSFPEHVIVGLRCSDGWALYDDLQSEYGHFNPENADFIEDFFIIFAVYVDIPQDEVFGTECVLFESILNVNVLSVNLTQTFFYKCPSAFLKTVETAPEFSIIPLTMDQKLIKTDSHLSVSLSIFFKLNQCNILVSELL